MKRDTSRKNIPKKLRKRIRNINNGYLRAKILERPKNIRKNINKRVNKL